MGQPFGRHHIWFVGRKPTILATPVLHSVTHGWLNYEKQTVPIIGAGILFHLQLSTLHAQGTAFTYQGRLSENGSPANGNYDLQFYLRDAATAGNPIGTTNTVAPVAVSNGLFTVTLDLGVGVFTGPARWLEIGVRTNGSVAAYSILSPRQALTPSPYAIFATTSGTASNVVNGSVVKSLNGLNDIVTLAAGSNVTITPSGNTLTLAAAGVGGSGIWSVNGNNAYYNAGNVGIGTAGPVTPLEVNGIVRSTRSNNAAQYLQLDGGDPGSIRLAAQSIVSAEKNLFIQNLNGEATPGANNNIQFVLGTTASPSIKMTLTKDGNVILPLGGSGGSIQFGTPATETGMTIIGANRADVRFDGSTLKLVAGSGTGIPSCANGIAINTAGNVGIGVTSPANKLSVSGNADFSGNVGIGTTAPVAKLHAETGLANTAAVYGYATGSGGVGVYGQSAAGAAVHAEGNATQARDKGGFVKAMAYIDPFLSPSQYVVRCYNSQRTGNATSTAPCGITVTRLGPGSYRVDFGFDVRDRFISVTTAEIPATAGAFPVGNTAPNAVQVLLYDPQFQVETDSRFFVFVF